MPLTDRLDALFADSTAKGLSALNTLLKIEGHFQNAVKPENTTLPVPAPAEYGDAMHWLDAKLAGLGLTQFMENEKLAKERNADWFSKASVEAFQRFVPNYTAERRAIWQAVRAKRAEA